MMYVYLNNYIIDIILVFVYYSIFFQLHLAASMFNATVHFLFQFSYSVSENNMGHWIRGVFSTR